MNKNRSQFKENKMIKLWLPEGTVDLFWQTSRIIPLRECVAVFRMTIAVSMVPYRSSTPYHHSSKIILRARCSVGLSQLGRSHLTGLITQKISINQQRDWSTTTSKWTLNSQPWILKTTTNPLTTQACSSNHLYPIVLPPTSPLTYPSLPTSSSLCTSLLCVPWQSTTTTGSLSKHFLLLRSRMSRGARKDRADGEQAALRMEEAGPLAGVERRLFVRSVRGGLISR